MLATLSMILAMWCAADTVSSRPPPDDRAIPDAAPPAMTLDDLGRSADMLTGDPSAEEDERLDVLLWHAEHPFDLNVASLDELESIPGVTPERARAVLELRTKLKRFSSVEQLRLVDPNGDELARILGPFVVASDRSEDVHAPVVHLRVRAVEIPNVSDDGTQTYLGSSVKSYDRLTVNPGKHWEMGALTVKDPGERFADALNTGYVMMEDVGPISRAVVGDYVVETGQGLVFWRSAQAPAGAGFGGGRKSPLGVEPFHSTSESVFLRGAALTLGPFRGATLTLLYSLRALGANMDDSGNITSVYESGLYRTPGELAKRNILRERVIGGRIAYACSQEWTAGATFCSSVFDRPVPGGNALTPPSSLSQTRSVDLAGRLGRLNLFCEGALSGGSNSALVAGVNVDLGPNASASFAYRNFSPRFTNRRAGAFTDDGGTSNEAGMSVGWTFPVTRRLIFRGDFDQFRHPWRTFLTALPSAESEIVLETLIDPEDDLGVSIRYIVKKTECSQPAHDALNREIDAVTERGQQRLRLCYSYKAGPCLHVKGGMEGTAVSYQLGHRTESGFLLYHELRFAPHPRLGIEGRITMFQTGSYDSRLYALEDDVPGAAASPALYGHGERWSLLIRSWIVHRVLEISAKLSSTRKEPAGVTAAGVLELPPPEDRRVSLQLDLALP